MFSDIRGFFSHIRQSNRVYSWSLIECCYVLSPDQLPQCQQKYSFCSSTFLALRASRRSKKLTPIEYSLFALKKSCQSNRQAALRFFLQGLRVNDGGKVFCFYGSGKRLEVVRGTTRDGVLE